MFILSYVYSIIVTKLTNTITTNVITKLTKLTNTITTNDITKLTNLTIYLL